MGNRYIRQHVTSFAILAIIAAGFLLRLITYISAPHSIIAYDEVFQTLEPAHRIAFGYGIVTWEWRDGVRSELIPDLIALIMRFDDLLHLSYLATIHILLCLISSAWIFAGYLWARSIAGIHAAILTAWTLAIWPDLLFYAAHPLIENIAGACLIPALTIYFIGRRNPLGPISFGVGFGLALGVLLRIQFLPILAILLPYFLQKSFGKRIAFILGFFAATTCYGLADWHQVGVPFLTDWRYFAVNLMEGKNEQFGTEPWYWYGKEIFYRLGLLFLLIPFGLKLSGRIALLALFVIGYHSVIPHKEMRFIIITCPLLLAVAATGLSQLLKIDTILKERPLSSSKRLIVACTMLALIATDRYRSVGRPVDFSETTLISKLSERSDLCGLGLHGVTWLRSGGYTLLHRNVPIIETADADKISHTALFTNYVLAHEPLPDSDFSVVECKGDLCIYRRSGNCLHVSYESSINGYLRNTDQ